MFFHMVQTNSTGFLLPAAGGAVTFAISDLPLLIAFPVPDTEPVLSSRLAVGDGLTGVLCRSVVARLGGVTMGQVSQLQKVVDNVEIQIPRKDIG